MSQARFLLSATRIQNIIKEKPQFCVLGRSNSGKSSFLRALFETSSLVKTSKKPGHTVQMNCFSYNGRYYIDLPGYGFAKLSKKEKVRISELIDDYLRTALYTAGFLTLDSRRELREEEFFLIEGFKESRKPLNLIFTKVDKLKQKEMNQLRNKKQNYEKYFHNIFLISALKKTGYEEVRNYVGSF